MKKQMIFLTLLIFLVACQNKEAANESSTRPTENNTNSNRINIAPSLEVDNQTIVQFAVDEYEITQYDDLIQAFQEENHDIRIRLFSVNELLELDPVSGDGLPTDAALQLAQSVDVFPARYSADAADNVIRDLTPFMQADDTFGADDFYSNSLKDVNGRIYTLPTSLNYLLIQYNKDAFDNARLAYPQPGWTWDDFRSIANTLTLRDGGEVTQWGLAQPFSTHLPFIEGQLQNPLADSRTSPPTFRFSDEDVITAVKWYTTLFQTDESAPIIVPTEAHALIQANQVSMWPESSSNLPADDSKIGIAPFPNNADASNTTPFFVNGWVMSAGTVHTEAAWKWMTYLSRQQPPNTFANPLPARASVAEATGFWDKLTPEQSVPLRYAVEHSYLAQFSNRDDYRVLNEAINRVLEEEETVEAALSTAQMTVTTLPTANETVESFTIIQEADQETDISTVTFIIKGANNSQDLEAFRELAKAFEENHPDIRLDVRANSMRSINFTASAGSADCLQWFEPIFTPEEQAAVLSLDPFIEADASFSLDEFYPELVNQFVDDGQLWGIPAEIYPTFIEYNQTIFDAANVSYPQLGWTMDEFLQTAVSLTTGSDDNKQYGFAANAYEPIDLIFMLDRLGAALIDDKVTPPTTSFNAPETVAAMRWYTNLTTEFGVKPVFISDPADINDNPDRFFLRPQLLNQGRIAMWTIPSFGDAIDMEPALRETMSIGVVSIPAGAGSGLTSAAGYYISATTAHRDTCWQWIKFLTASPNIGQGLPANRSVAESDAYRQRIGNKLTDVYLATINNATGFSTSFRLFSGSDGWMLEAIYWLGRAYAQITDGDATVEEALNEAQAIFDAYRTCMIANDGFADVEVRNSCIQENDPLFPAFLLERR